MISQFYISSNGLSAYQRVMYNITNNIANAQTPGFKSSRVELETMFPGVLEEAMKEQEEASTTDERIQKKRRIEFGMGVKISDVVRDFRQGRVEITGQPLDLAINGDGFFRFKLRDGTIAYGRAGNLQKDRDGNVMDPNGNLLDPPIRIPQNTTNLTIDETGRVFVQRDNETQASEIGQITLARFENPATLQSIGHNLYLESALSGPPRLLPAGDSGMGTITQNSLEFSNVNVVQEMMNMVIVQRSYDMATKAIKVGEDMLKSAQEIAKA